MQKRFESAVGDFPILKTKRLILREIVAADAPALFAIYSDVDAMRWFGTDPLTDVEEAVKLVETFAEWRKAINPGTRWAIVQNTTGRLIGTCGLFKWSPSRRSCTVGYELAQQARGNGFMCEALSAILDWGFEHMSLNRVEAQVHPENKPSIKLIARLRFVREGLLRQASFWLGEYRDLVQFSLLRSEYSLSASKCDDHSVGKNGPKTSSTNQGDSVRLRRATAADRDFLFETYKTTLQRYVDWAWGWDEDFQRNGFWKHFPLEQFRVVTVDEQMAGGIFTEEQESLNFIRLIFLLPGFQSRGIGTTLLMEEVACAAKVSKPLHLKVVKINPAKALYDRLGFTLVEENDATYHMQLAV